MLLWLVSIAAAAGPFRAPAHRILDLQADAGRTDRLTVKLAEGAGIRWDGDELVGLDPDLADLLSGALPLFARPREALRADRAAFDPEHRLADLSLYLSVEADDPVSLGAALQAHAQVEHAYLAFAPVPPPEDIAPETPDFSGQQLYRGPAPEGIGIDAASRWPGGDGSNVAIADVEYGWQVDHEDLGAVTPGFAWGVRHEKYTDLYSYHGTGVLGMLVAGDNGYGVTGLVPGAEALVVSPFSADGGYNVAAAIDGAASLLEPGDVLLIEQQAVSNGVYVPVSISPAVFDAISVAVAKGIVVVEPAGNGATSGGSSPYEDLDDPIWEGWFDRQRRDSGSIMVGGGASPLSEHAARDRAPGGSCYGSRVDVQGWYDNIVTTAEGSLANLFSTEDGLQGYTSYFSGTSGASPMVAAVAAIASSVSIEVRGQPWDPIDLRAAIASTGTPQAGDSGAHIGPLPDLRRLMWTWGAR